MKKFFALVSLVLICYVAKSQGLGEVFTPQLFDRMPQQANLISSDYLYMPSSHSLRPYCPNVKSQGNYGTCTSWATAYYARTICEAVNNEWTDKQTITDEAFSPTFVYALVKEITDHNCSKGANTFDAMMKIKEKGVPKLRDLPYQCSEPNILTALIHSSAQRYKIDNVIALWGILNANRDKVVSVKKALSENCPVCISFQVFHSFHTNHGSDCWYGKTSVSDAYVGGHAICVIGYDDNKYGGAFEIINSWGPEWGNGGYCWITYDAFRQYTNYAVQMICRTRTVNKQFSGSLKFNLSTGEEMRASLNNASYRIAGEYISGTRYRIYISNNQPAYVYVIGSDLQNNVSKVFPPDNLTSAYLGYKSNNIAIPDESWFVEMDNTKGKDYICVLYSAEELDINSIVSQIKNTYGSFYDKVNSVLGSKIVPRNEINYSQNMIQFSAQSNRTIVPIITEIIHR